MATVTDAAKEIAGLCRTLCQNVDQKGDEYLANQFKVKAWSADFYRIIFCIIDRIDGLETIIDTLPADDDIKVEAKKNLTEMRKAFSQQSLVGNWKANGGPHFLRRENSQPIMMLSTLVRHQEPLPKLDDEERNELIADVGDLVTRLREIQIDEQDFIRQALIEGLEQFRFTVEHLTWVGWGYTLRSLREVVGAYLALERGGHFAHASGQMSEIGDLLVSLFEKVNSKVEVARKFNDIADLFLKIYGAASAVTDTVKVSGLLPCP